RMAIKKNLYQVLQVARNATPDQVKAACEARMQALGTNATPEAINERSLLKQASDILSDPTRRKLYDAKLVEEAARGAGSGGDALAPSPQPVMQRRAEEAAARTSSATWFFAFVGLMVVGIAAGTWLYLDKKRNAELARQLKLKQAEEERL